MSIASQFKDSFRAFLGKPTARETKALWAAASFQALERARAESSFRITSSRKVHVAHYSSDGRQAKNHLVPPGTVCVFVAKKDSEISQLLLDATSGSGESADSAARLIIEETKGRKPVTVPEAVDQLVHAPSFGEVTHCGQVLAANLFIPDGVTCCPIALPYNGGQLDGNEISFTEFRKTRDSESFDIYAFKNPPEDLTEAELNALNDIGDAQASLNLGPAICYALTLVTVAAAVSAATGVCCPRPNTKEPPWIDPPGPDPHDPFPGTQLPWVDPSKTRLDSLTLPSEPNLGEFGVNPDTTARALLKKRRDQMLSAKLR